MKIQILMDNPNSWMVPYAKQLQGELLKKGHTVLFHSSAESVSAGDILLLLSCEKIFRDLHLNTHNLVVHASALPQGKGMSPTTWQILEGKNIIPLTLFEATAKVDSGTIYAISSIQLNGTELIEEIREKEGYAINVLIHDFVNSYPNLKGYEPVGDESFYRRRTPENSELDINKTISEQFNLLRVVDNERYPAFFRLNEQKYILKIEKADE